MGLPLETSTMTFVKHHPSYVVESIRHGYLRYEMYGNKSKSFYVKFVFLIL